MARKSLNFVGALIVVAGMILTGCSTAAHVEKDKSANFSKYKTYSWIENDQSKGAKNRHNDLTERSIHNAVNRQLEKSGWREVSSNPDVLISADLLVERNQKKQQDPVYTEPYTRTYYNPYTKRFSSVYFPSQFAGYDSYTTQVKEGTVTVTMIDTQTDKTVWQGWATNELNSGHITDKEIDHNVKSIFKKFDAGK